jgi:L-lactate permease
MLLLASLPILFFVFALTVFKLRMTYSAATVLALTIVIASTFFHMPVLSAFSATIDGFAYGLLPIGWIILNVIFLYRLTVHSGAFDTVRASIAAVTPDARLQLILIGFAFSAFLEGAAGYGTPVAITAALLVGLGFQPLKAAALCLVANTAPVAFGAMGTSLTVAAQVSHVSLEKIGHIAGLQLPFLSLVALVWITVSLSGWKKAREILPALLLSGVVFAGTMILVAQTLGVQLPGMLAGLFTMIALTLFLKFWQPKHLMILSSRAENYSASIPAPKLNFKNILHAWLPYLLLTGFVVLWSSKAFQSLFAPGAIFSCATLLIEMPNLNGVTLKLDFVAAIGTGIFAAAVLSSLFLKIKIADTVKIFGETCKNFAPMILGIGLILAVASVSNHSGMSATIANTLAKTGWIYPLFAPLIGTFGVFVTGSDTSSNALFAPLQASVAQHTGASDALLVAANSLGGAAGKMISPQSIAVASAAVGLMGREGELLKQTLKTSLIFACVSGVAVFAMSLF